MKLLSYFLLLFVMLASGKYNVFSRVLCFTSQCEQGVNHILIINYCHLFIQRNFRNQEIGLFSQDVESTVSLESMKV